VLIDYYLTMSLNILIVHTSVNSGPIDALGFSRRSFRHLSYNDVCTAWSPVELVFYGSFCDRLLQLLPFLQLYMSFYLEGYLESSPLLPPILKLKPNFYPPVLTFQGGRGFATYHFNQFYIALTAGIASFLILSFLPVLVPAIYQLLKWATFHEHSIFHD